MFAPVSPRHNESRECIEAEGERAGDDIEVEQTRKSPWREGSIPVARKRGGRSAVSLVRCYLFILVKSRNDEERRKSSGTRKGKCARHEIREMMPSFVSTPSAAIRTKRIARSLPPPVHDDDRKDDFVAKMYFTDDIDGGIELDWCTWMEGGDMRMERWNGRRMGWVCGGGKGNHLLHFEIGRTESFTRAFVYFCLRLFHRPRFSSSKSISRTFFVPFLFSSESACE